MSRPLSAHVASVVPPVASVQNNSAGSPNDRRNLQKRQRAEYHRNQRNLGVGARTHVETDDDGNAIGLRTMFHRAIRDIAGRLLDVTSRDFSSHPELAFELIARDIDSKFTFDRPLRPRYIKEYLRDALSWTRYAWRSHWYEHKKRHPQCPAKLYPVFVAHWDTPEAHLEHERMSNARRQRKKQKGAEEDVGVSLESLPDSGKSKVTQVSGVLGCGM